MAVLHALGSGLVGASVVTLLNEGVRQIVPEAPRLDLLGMRGLARLIRGADQTPPPQDELRALALAGDIASNAVYFSLVGVGGPEGAMLRGAVLGGVAGIGALLLPGPLGLGEAPSNRTTATQVMTVAWYTAGGLAAAAVYRRWARRSDQ